jgi:hypothetical protein
MIVGISDLLIRSPTASLAAEPPFGSQVHSYHGTMRGTIYDSRSKDRPPMLVVPGITPSEYEPVTEL